MTNGLNIGKMEHSDGQEVFNFNKLTLLILI